MKNSKASEKNAGPTLNLGLGGKCDYKCVFCSRGPDDYFKKISFNYEREYQEAGRQLYSYSKERQKPGLAISRDEPANHPYILNVIRFARKTGFKKIELQTSGMRLGDKKFLKSLVGAGLTSVALPVYGVTPAVHDAIVGLPGAWGILERAVEALRSLKVGLRFRTIVLRQNLHEIEKIAERYKCFVAFPYPTASRLKYKDLCVRLSEIPKSVRGALDLRIPCVNGLTAESCRFAGVVFGHTANPELTQAAANSNAPSFKPKKCKSCAMNGKCEGIFREYVKIYGEDEFRPVK